MKPHWAERWRWPTGVAPWVSIVMLSVLLPACSPSQAKYAYGWERWFYPSISGRVVDAETGEPVEGAVAFCIWTKQHGLPGLLYTKVAKVSESVSDKEGRFRIDGTLDLNVAPPNLTVYKRGYVAWSNKEVFPGQQKRDDFRWKNDVAIRLEKWQEGYSFVEHEHFICLRSEFPEIETKHFQFFRAVEWETNMRIQERKNQIAPDGGAIGGGR